MSANDGAVNEQVFEVWINGAELMQLFKDAGVSPTGKAYIDRIPIAVFFGQQLPLPASDHNLGVGEAEFPPSLGLSFGTNGLREANSLQQEKTYFSLSAFGSSAQKTHSTPLRCSLRIGSRPRCSSCSRAPRCTVA